MLRAAVLSVGLAGTTPASSLLLLRGSSFAAPHLLAAPPRVVAARGVSSAKGGRGGKGMAEFRNPHNLPVKTCVVCDRPFTWRKKWERCWDEVTTCSKSCNAARKREKRAENGADDRDDDDDDARSGGDDGGGASDAEEESGGPDGARDARREQRKAAKKAAKAEKRAKRGGGDGIDAKGGLADDGRKACDGCGARVDLLIRCQTDATRAWTMRCGKCWKVASGGVPDGDADHPHYRYGGLWKNRRAVRRVSTAVPDLDRDEASLRVK